MVGARFVIRFGPLAIKVKQKREPVNRQKREKVDQVHVKEVRVFCFK